MKESKMSNTTIRNEDYQLFMSAYEILSNAQDFESYKVSELISTIISSRPEILSIQHPKTKLNLGMICATLQMEDLVTAMLDANPECALQQDKLGANIGMYAARYELEDATLKALDNEEASVQQDCVGNNIGMIAAHHKLKTAAKKALTNETATNQTNDFDMNIRAYMLGS